MNQTNDTPRCVMVVDDQAEIHAAFESVLISNVCKQFELKPITIPALETRLMGTQFRIRHATNGSQAVKLLWESNSNPAPIEMAFVDLGMSGPMDGIETIQALWDIDEDLQVVAFTTDETCSWRVVLQRLGYSDSLLLLKKPFADEEVYQLAMALTNKRRRMNECSRQLAELAATNRQLQAEIGQRLCVERKLQYAATHDSLTNLPNREFIRQAITKRIQQRELDQSDRSAINQRAGGRTHQFGPSQVNVGEATDALFFLDVDNFKYINDSLGHNVGDELLVQIARRIAAIHQFRDPACSPDASLVARLGGDEFVLFLQDLAHHDEALRIADVMRNRLIDSYTLEGHSVEIGISLGVAFLTQRTTSPEQLMRNADLAMYRAKFSGKQCLAVFDEGMHRQAARRMDLENALRAAVKEQSFSLTHQPIMRVSNGELVGFEALLRWDYRPGESVSPAEFIPIAEETGLIIPIGRWVLQQACHMLSTVNRSRPKDRPLSISVNVSKRQVLDPYFARELLEILEANQLNAQQINLEITESVVMDNPELIANRLHELKLMGVHLHMDDFGTGQSSLSCLHRFPIDALKIDRSFVSAMESNADYESIVHAIITLAHSLNTTVIAEGIETEEQLQRLRELDCDFGQGYLFSRPMQLHELQIAVNQESSFAAPVCLPAPVAPSSDQVTG